MKAISDSRWRKRLEKEEFEESKTRQEARDDEDMTLGTCGERMAWSMILSWET